MTWQTFAIDVWKNTNPCVDAIIVGVPNGLPKSIRKAAKAFHDEKTEHEMKAFAKFSHWTIASGLYVIIFTSMRCFMRWYTYFKEEQF